MRPMRLFAVLLLLCVVPLAWAQSDKARRFPAPSGTPITSAARGTGSFVGWKDGYER